MIVTCERCSTQFRLDDKRVPEQGVRVRCSRCKYAFRVERPVSSEEERIRRAAARGLEPDTPEITQDLPDEEEDWEFNDHRPTADAQVSEGGGIAAEPDAQEGPDEGDIAAESAGEGEGSPLQKAGGGSGDAYGLGADTGSQSVETLDAYDNDAPLAPSGLDLENRSASFESEQLAGPFDHADQEQGESGLDLAGSGAPSIGLDPGNAEKGQSEPAKPTSPVVGPEAAEEPAASEEMGSPDKWDFFAADSSEQGAGSMRVRMTATPPRARVPRSTPVPRDLLSEDSKPHSHWFEAVVGGVGWVVVVAALAAGLYGGFAPNARGAAAAAVSQRVAGLQIADVSGRWVENLVAGDLYVVSGAARRDATVHDAARSGLFVILLDAEGERLRLAPIPVGPPLPQSLLRQAAPADLQRAAGQVISPGPGASLRIEAVIPNPPAAASAFRFVTAAELATRDADTSAPLAPADRGDASGEPLLPEPEVRPEHPDDAP